MIRSLLNPSFESLQADSISNIATSIVDSLSGLKDAINNASDGDRIYIGSGTYTIGGSSDQLKLNANNVAIVGAGMDETTIKLGSNADVKPFQIGTDASSPYSYIHLSDFTVDGNEANQSDTSVTKHGIEGVDCTDVVVERVKCIDTHPSRIDDSTGSDGGSGFQFKAACQRITIRDCQALRNGWRGIESWADRSEVINPYVVDPDDRGVSFSRRNPSTTEYGDNVRCIGGYVESGPFPGSCVATFQSTGMTVVGTVCSPQSGKALVSNRNGANVTIAGVTAASNANHASSNSYSVRLQSVSDATVTGVVDDYPNTGIELTGCDDVAISGYSLTRTNDGVGFLIDNCTDVSVSGFAIKNPQNNFLVTRNGSTDISITNGRGRHDDSVKSSGHGVYVKGSSTARVMVSDVAITGPHSNGVEIEGKECHISNVAIRDPNSNGTSTAFNETSGAGRVDWRDCTTVASEVSTVWSLSNPDSTVEGGRPAFDVFRGLSPSSGSVSVSFNKPYTSKPLLNIVTESEAIPSVSYSTNANNNYNSATISFVDNSGSAVNPTTHVDVVHRA